MTWVRLDDQHDIHRKIARLSDLAYRIWVSGMAWCHRQRTPGLIPAGDAALIVPGRKAREVSRAVSELVECGLWHATPEGHAYHDWQHYQTNPGATASERGKAGAAKRWGHSSEPIATIAKQVSHDGKAVANDAPIPIPIPIPRSDPDPDLQPPDPEVSVGNPGQIPADWEPESQDWAQAFVTSVPEPLQRALVRRFRSHHLDGEARTPVEWRRSFRHWAPRTLETRLAELQADVRAEEEAARAAGKAEAKQAEESEALARHRAKLAEAARRAALTPAQRDVEDALESLRRAQVTLSHPGLPLTATAPARAAKRQALATLAKHGVEAPGEAQRSA